MLFKILTWKPEGRGCSEFINPYPPKCQRSWNFSIPIIYFTHFRAYINSPYLAPFQRELTTAPGGSNPPNPKPLIIFVHVYFCCCVRVSVCCNVREHVLGLVSVNFYVRDHDHVRCSVRAHGRVHVHDRGVSVVSICVSSRDSVCCGVCVWVWLVLWQLSVSIAVSMSVTGSMAEFVSMTVSVTVSMSGPSSPIVSN